VLPVDRETGRPRGFAFVDYADRAVAEAAIRKFDQQPFKGRGLAVSEARPREERGPGGPRPGGFSGPRPGGFSGPRPATGAGGFAGPRPGGFAPRPGEGSVARPGNKNFGPDAPPKHKRKPNKERDKPRGPIKERPVGRLYDADEDWRTADTGDDIDVDNVATHKDYEKEGDDEK
jgi:RNA recognition motif-containing protein